MPQPSPQPASHPAPRPTPQPAAVLASQGHRCLSGSALKLIAVLTMLVDHVAAHILTGPYWMQPFFAIGTKVVSRNFLLRTVGRLAFPIYCFLLVEGFCYTRDRRRYARNLLLFAVISEVPFDLARSLKAIDPTYQNVFWTLLISYLGMWAYEHFAQRPAMQATCVIGLGLLSIATLCDYRCTGYALVLILYLLRDDALAKTVLGGCVTSATWRAGLAFIPINLYNGTRGFVRGPWLKYAFYAFYPVHLLVIWWVRTHVGV